MLEGGLGVASNELSDNVEDLHTGSASALGDSSLDLLQAVVVASLGELRLVLIHRRDKLVHVAELFFGSASLGLLGSHLLLMVSEGHLLTLLLGPDLVGLVLKGLVALHDFLLDIVEADHLGLALFKVIETGGECSFSLSLDVLDQSLFGHLFNVLLIVFVVEGGVRDHINVLLELEFVVLRSHLFVVVCKIYF